MTWERKILRKINIWIKIWKLLLGKKINEKICNKFKISRYFNRKLKLVEGNGLACQVGWWKDNKGVTGRQTRKWKRKKLRWT